eukprot:scaffold123324_cov55-Phaeocystis_antarctica.AAC.3
MHTKTHKTTTHCARSVWNPARYVLPRARRSFSRVSPVPLATHQPSWRQSSPPTIFSICFSRASVGGWTPRAFVSTRHTVSPADMKSAPSVGPPKQQPVAGSGVSTIRKGSPSSSKTCTPLGVACRVVRGAQLARLGTEGRVVEAGPRRDELQLCDREGAVTEREVELLRAV